MKITTEPFRGGSWVALNRWRRVCELSCVSPCTSQCYVHAESPVGNLRFRLPRYNNLSLGYIPVSLYEKDISAVSQGAYIQFLIAVL